MNEQTKKVLQQALEAFAVLKMNDYSGYECTKHETDKIDDAETALRQLLEQPVQEPSFGGVVFAIEEAIRNGDCPFSIEIAFEAYESERIAMLSAAPTGDKLTPIQKKEPK